MNGCDQESDGHDDGDSDRDRDNDGHSVDVLPSWWWS